ncbi:MAG TPA: GDYXXLXY domain-containing protein [Candidatus Mailhella merdavium]|nr:GDYXXLXY domain-containing protein [Candidatus Mailhella merdavium]
MRTSPEVLAGPALLFIVLILTMRRHYAPALYELALTGLVLLNSLLTRLALESRAMEPTSWILLFAVFNIAYTVFLVRFLPRAVRPSAQRPPSAQMSRNIPQTDVRQTQLSPARPLLFPTILTGLGGFLSAIFLIALNILLFSASSDAAYLALGCIHTTAGAFLWHVRGRSVFLLTLAPVLIAAGVVFFQFGGNFLPVPLLIVCVWAAGLVLYARLKNAPLRFGLALWTLGNTFVQGICSLPAEFVAPAAQLFGLFCFLPIVASAWGRKLPAALRPAAYACIWVLIALTSLFKDSTPFLLGLPETALLSDLLLRSLGTAALILLMRRFLSEQRKRDFSYSMLLLSAVCALGLIWYFTPAETLLALTLIFVGRSAYPAKKEARYDVPLFGIGLLLFAASLVFFYYHLALPFSAKALSMGLPGICLLFGGTILSHYSRSPDNTSRPAPGVSSSRLPRNMFLRRAAPLIAAGVLLPLLFSLAVSDRRELLRDGRQILLALVPRDPRAFILGDYMELRYEVEQNLLVEAPGCLPLSIDEQGIAQPIPKHFLQGKTCRDVPFPALYLEPDLLSVRLRLPHRYYFEEGLAPLYENARYAALRCDERNACLLEGLADADGQLIEN